MISFDKVSLWFLVFVLISQQLALCGILKSNDTKCDPFPFGTNIVNVVVATVVGKIFPNSCPCKFPCNVDKVGRFVHFYYTKSGDQYYYEFDVNSTEDRNALDRSAPISFLVHGYTDKVRFNGTGWMEPTGMVLANVTNATVILIDYGDISDCNYDRTVEEIVPQLGLYLSQVISDLDLDPNNIEIIGHSLGAHIAGYAAGALKGSIKRITGLDPAGPGFQTNGNGLNRSCAQYVQVLHTNAGELGTNKSIGDADFFANFGTVIQPGCPFKQCGHAKALFYYYASLFSQNEFIGVDCEQQDAKQIDLNSRFGYFTDGKIGEFCFNTTACFPYTLPQSENMTEYVNSSAPDSLAEFASIIEQTNLILSESNETNDPTNIEFHQINSDNNNRCDPNDGENC